MSILCAIGSFYFSFFVLFCNISQQQTEDDRIGVITKIADKSKSCLIRVFKSLNWKSFGRSLFLTVF